MLSSDLEVTPIHKLRSGDWMLFDDESISMVIKIKKIPGAREVFNMRYSVVIPDGNVVKTKPGSHE